MDSTNARLEWQKDAGPTTTNCDQDQCIPEGLGSVLLWNIYGRCWSQEDPHQVRQYNSGALSESHGGTKSQRLIDTARQVGEWCF